MTTTTATNWPTNWPRSAFIGFERIFDELERSRTGNSNNNNSGYPPHNVIRIDDDNYEIELAVAGFDKSDIEVTFKDDVLSIEGKKEGKEENGYIHRGISNRKFTKTFNLSEHIEIRGADLVNGILSVRLERVIPEEHRPKIIKIGSTKTKKSFLQD